MNNFLKCCYFTSWKSIFSISITVYVYFCLLANFKQNFVKEMGNIAEYDPKLCFKLISQKNIVFEKTQINAFVKQNLVLYFKFNKKIF